MDDELREIVQELKDLIYHLADHELDGDPEFVVEDITKMVAILRKFPVDIDLPEGFPWTELG